MLVPHLYRDLGFKATRNLGMTIPKGFDPQARGYFVELWRKSKGRETSETFHFFQGSGIKEEPTKLNVLGCLLLDARTYHAGLEEYESEFGEEMSARMSARMFFALRDTAEKLEALGVDANAVNELCDTVNEMEEQRA